VFAFTVFDEGLEMAMEVGSFDSFVGELVRGNEKVVCVDVEEVQNRLEGGGETDVNAMHMALTHNWF